MVKQAQRAEFNSFGKGLITEASPLAFPDGAASELVNFEINADGTLDRRLGFDAEALHEWFDTGITEIKAFTTFLWKNVSGIAANQVAVVQVNNKLFLFDANISPLSTAHLDTITITGAQEGKIFSFTSIDGRLVVASGIGDLVVVISNPAMTTFTSEVMRLMVRDLWGVEETISQYETDQTYRGATDDAHTYNLQNQSWAYPRKDDGNTFKDVLDIYKTVDGKYPSNSEMVWTGLEFKPDGTTPFERVVPSLYKERFGEDLRSARGTFIIDLLNRGASRLSAVNHLYTNNPEITNKVVTLPTDATPGGASTISEYAGRVFYAGFTGAVTQGDKRSPVLNNYIFFSKLVKSQTELTQCYQQGDPTSRDNSDVLDTDGGFIRLAEANNILKLIPVEKTLIVLADNGIWSVAGGTDTGFTATAYIVTKLSDFGCSAPNSVLSDGANVLYMSADGFYVLSNNQYGDQVVQSISIGTIQKIFDRIPLDCRKTVYGFFDIYNKKVRWLFKHTPTYFGNTESYELVFDIVQKCFTMNTIYALPSGTPEIVGMVERPVARVDKEIQAIFVNDNTVSVGSDIVGEELRVRDGELQTITYCIASQMSGSVRITFGGYNNTSFKDWGDIDQLGSGVDAKATLVTGAITAGDSSIFKQTPYITTHMRRTESGIGTGGVPTNQSGCFVQAQWEWATSSTSGKWSRPEQIYRYRTPLFSTASNTSYDNGFQLVTAKSKLRGRGRAVSLLFTTEPEKDCRLVGWNLSLNGNSI